MLIAWLILSAFLLHRFGFAHYGLFDAEQRWHFDSPGLAVSALHITPEQGFQVVHVLDDNCGCSRFAAAHAKVFAGIAAPLAKQQWYRSAAEVAAAGFTLPAVPAVLLFEQGQLVYAGPYASGPLCSVRDSFLVQVLSGQVHLAGLWLNGESNACRCLVSSLSK